MLQPKIIAKAYKALQNKDFAQFRELLHSKDEVPTSETVNELFIKLWEYWEAIEEMALMVGDNKPSQQAIDYTFPSARTLDKIEFFCKKSTTKPSATAITHKLNWLCNYNGDWDAIEYLCFLDTDNKPPQAVIDQVLESAFGRKPELVKRLYRMQGTNQPSKAGIKYILGKYSAMGDLEVVQELCQMSDLRCPDSMAVSNAFKIAASSGHINILRFFSGMKSENKPNQDVFAQSIVLAARHDKVESVAFFTQLEADKRPSQELINQALLEAINTNRIQVIKFLFSEANPIKPDDAGVTAAFIASGTVGNYQAIEYFIHPRNHFSIKQSDIDDALIAAGYASSSVGACKIIQRLANPTSPLASAEAIYNAALGASTQKNYIMESYLMGILRRPLLQAAQAEDVAKSTSDAASLKSLKTAVTSGIKNYLAWSNGDNSMRRHPHGFFTLLRHGQTGRDRAEKLRVDLSKAQTIEAANKVIDTFLKAPDTRYHNHSLSQFLLDELAHNPVSSVLMDEYPQYTKRTLRV